MRNDSFGQRNQSILDRVIKRLREGEIINSIPENSILLDIGCGYNGELLNTLVSKIKVGIGIDISVAKSINKKIDLKQLDIQKNLPFKDSTFDVVSAVAVLEHLQYPQEILVEIHRVLKPGGILIITTPSTYAKPLLEFLAFKLGVISKEEIADHKQYFNLASLEKALNKAGFQNNQLHYFELGMNLFDISVK